MAGKVKEMDEEFVLDSLFMKGTKQWQGLHD
jgi:hypothetical protein